MKKNSIIFLLLTLIFILLSCNTKKFDNVIINYDKINSPYKHINNGGLSKDDKLPYNIDAITGATMTVEGPGVVASIPLSIREIENTNEGQVRGLYKDSNGIFYYEGLDLYYLLNNMQNGDNGIKLTEKSYRVILKNSNREDISKFTLKEIENAHNENRPIILSYGIANSAEEKIAPFVYDSKDGNTNSLGYINELKNNDGCIKLVYDLNKFKNKNYKTFSNVAYVYIAEENEPGFKHTDNNVNPLFNSSKYTDYIITFRGSELKNEICLTVNDLEDLVIYDKNGKVIKDGIGYNDYYSMANNAYWYVNQYEGVDLYKLLLYLGMENAEDMGRKKSRTTLVQFLAADGAKSNEMFSIDTLSYNEAFGFYKKNVQDNNDGTYTPTNEDLVKLGYPVLIAYGVNNYPYTILKSDEAYVSGLSNSGGPVHVIFGKTEYNHPNGSNQIQYLDAVLVGDDILYNTHSYTDNEDIKQLSNEYIEIIVNDENNNIIYDEKLTVKNIEDIIYSENVSKDNIKKYKIKNHYETIKDNKLDTDIYEGIDFSNFLLEYIKIPGINGKIIFENENNESINIDLNTVLKNGYNTTLNRYNTKSILAFSKNGKALVKNKQSNGYTDYLRFNPLHNEKSLYKVDNTGGPLKFIMPSDNLNNFNGYSIDNINKITINLYVDKYSHLNNDNDNLKNNILNITGKGIDNETNINISNIEKYQTKIKTYKYTINNNKIYYRGIPVYELLKTIGIKNNAGDVNILSNNNNYTIPLSQIKNIYYNNDNNDGVVAILAYGVNDINDDILDGRSLNKIDGGPLKLIMIDEKDNDKYIIYDDITKIDVSANEILTWGHNMSDVYNEFLDYTFNIAIKNDKSEFSHDYKLSEIENMSDLIIRDKYLVLDIGEAEGIDIWKLVKKIYKKDNLNEKLVSTIFYAEDGYKNDVLSVIGLSALDNGINVDGDNKKVLLSYAVKGYPLVDTENHEGYTGLAKNADGPLRLIVENVQGASIKQCNKLVVTLSGDDDLNIDFNIE